MERRSQTDLDPGEDATHGNLRCPHREGSPLESPDRDPRQVGWTEHAAFADGLVERGTTVLGGPIETGDPEVVALLLVNAEGEQAVRAAFDADPWAASGVLRYKAAYPWTLWLDSRARAT